MGADGRLAAKCPGCLQRLLQPQDAFAAPNAAAACAHGFKYGAALDGLQEGVVFLLVASKLNGIAFVGNVDDAATEDICQPFDFFALFAHGAEFYHHHFALKVCAFG